MTPEATRRLETAAALRALGYTDAHAAALAGLFASEQELENVVVFIGFRLAEFPEDADLGPGARYWAEVIAQALRQRHPKATQEQATLAGQGAVLLALLAYPEALPVSMRVLPLLAAVDGQRRQ